MASASSQWPPCASDGGALAFSDLDCTAIQEQYRTRSLKLFCKADSDVLVEAATISKHGVSTQLFESESDLDSYLQTQNQNSSKRESNASAESQFFFLNPSYGWGLLEITESAMTKLLLQLNVFSRFFKYLSVFGIKTFPQDEGFGGFDHNIKLSTEGELDELESCYLLKYVDLKENPGSSNNPWSIRQALIYQKSLFQKAQDTFMFIRLPDALGGQFARLLNKERTDLKSPHWTQVQLMCLQSVTHNWRHYINWLDEQLSILFDRVILASVELKKLDDFDSVSSSLKDMKRLQYLIDQAFRASHMLDLNLEVIENIQTTAQRSAVLEGSSKADIYQTFDEALQTTNADHKFLRKNILSVSSRATILSDQLRDTVSLRNSEINKSIVTLTNHGTAAIVSLSQKSSREAQVVKILTVVALVFVPASFAADFLQMGYITAVPGDGFDVVADKTLWFYAILALPLIAVTLAIYFACEFAMKRSKAKKESWELDLENAAAFGKV